MTHLRINLKTISVTLGPGLGLGWPKEWTWPECCVFAVVAATWRCSSVTSQWLAHPDLSQCVSQRVANLTDAYTRFFDNVYVSTFLSTTTRRYFDHPPSGVVYISGPVCLSVLDDNFRTPWRMGSSYSHIRYIFREYGSDSYMKVME